jgi:hypothetical protein
VANRRHEAGTSRVWRAPGRHNGYSIRGLTAIGGALFFTAPTQVDGNGIATDFEPYILRPHVALDAGDETNVETTDDESAGDESEAADSAGETEATVDETGLPLLRKTASAGAASPGPMSAASR